MVCVGLLVVKPEDIPGLLRAIGRLWQQGRRFVRSAMQEVENVTQPLHQVLDDDGKAYPAYPPEELESIRAIARQAAPDNMAEAPLPPKEGEPFEEDVVSKQHKDDT